MFSIKRYGLISLFFLISASFNTFAIDHKNDGLEDGCFNSLSTAQATASHASQIDTVSAGDTLVCDDGTTFYLGKDAGIDGTCVVQAKKNGPIVYAQDTNGKLYAFEYCSDEGKLKRSSIFRLPVMGTLYKWLVDSSNTVQLPYMKDGTFAKWAISYFTFPEGPDVRTISLYIMTQTNPIILRNMDPWLPPWQDYNYPGPLGVTGVDVAAGHNLVAVIGYGQEGKKVFAYRPLNYDFTGGNPMISYRLSSGYIIEPYAWVKRIAKKIEVTSQVIDIPSADWIIVPLMDEHQPKIRVDDKGRYLYIPKNDGNCSVYDCEIKAWLNDVKNIFNSDASLTWPTFEYPIYTKPQKVRVTLNGEEGELTSSTQDPIMGIFTSKLGKKKPIYALPSNAVSVLFNSKTLFDEYYRPVRLSYLSKDQEQKLKELRMIR